MSRFILAAIVFVVFGAIGCYLLFRGHANTQSPSQEAENGAVSGCANTYGDSSASGGRAVKFGIASSGSCFTHPGILASKQQLQFVKSKIAAGAQPWASAYSQAKSSNYGKLTYPGSISGYSGKSIGSGHIPVGTKNCNSGDSKCIDCNSDSSGCQVMQADSTAAYTQAMLYYNAPSSDSNKDTYAQNALAILNNYAANMPNFGKMIVANAQQQLVGAWSGENFTKAAEIMRYTYTPPSGEATFHVSSFKNMLNIFLTAYDPTTDAAFHSNGNWHLSMIDAKIGIAVFDDDRSLFNQAVTEWRARVPSYIYLKSDGSQPKQPPYAPTTYSASQLKCFWFGHGLSSCSIPSGFAYADGQVQEQCRDINHATMGMEALVYTAETAYIQGTDLYHDTTGGVSAYNRITKGFEYLAGFDRSFIASGRKTYPSAPCGGPPSGTSGIGSTEGTETTGWEVVNNHFMREDPQSSLDFSDVQWMIGKYQPMSSSNEVVFETLSSSAGPY